MKMFDDDDDFPDYFLGDNADADNDSYNSGPADQPSAGDIVEPRSTSPRTISFSNADPASAPRPAPRTVLTGHDDLDDDDYPDYFLSDDDDDDDNAARRGRSGCLGGWFVGALIALFLVLGLIGYFRYLTPVVDQATMRVNVTGVERRGIFFKTFEAEIVDPGQLADTTTVYTHPRSVSVADETVAATLREARERNLPVDVAYEVYSATLPWRGASKTLITSASIAD